MPDENAGIQPATSRELRKTGGAALDCQQISRLKLPQRMDKGGPRSPGIGCPGGGVMQHDGC